MSGASRGVLITDGNERSALATTRALGRRGIPVYVGADSRTSLAGRPRYCSSAFQYPPPWKRPREYTNCVLEFAKRLNAEVFLPMTDVAVELIGEHSQELKGIVSIPTRDAYTRRHIFFRFLQVEFSSPKSSTLKSISPGAVA